MKMTTILPLALLAGCAGLTPQTPAPWTAVGLGSRSCQDFLARPQGLPSDRDPWVQWALGYISARNAGYADPDRSIGPRDLNDPLTRDPVKWLADWCNDHPQADFYQAVYGVLQKEEFEMRIRRLHERSDPPDWPDIP